MTSLVERLQAALADAELAANQCVERDWRVDGANSCQVYVRREDYSTRTIAWCGNGHEDDFSNVIHIAHNDPARVLRQVAAHRKILEIHSDTGDGDCRGCGLGNDGESLETVESCPTRLALVEGYGITEETAT